MGRNGIEGKVGREVNLERTRNLLVDEVLGQALLQPCVRPGKSRATKKSVNRIK